MRRGALEKFWASRTRARAGKSAGRNEEEVAYRKLSKVGSHSALPELFESLENVLKVCPQLFRVASRETVQVSPTAILQRRKKKKKKKEEEDAKGS
ncbi:hypothetical protein HPB49_024927 [Dermacentor silvarum]|uniref:Uncharacterized protein n=1 Tax=Dermacentor silvarum TaxID=543639 RepID=A0ACB8CCE0_DERSI|nr:hypothetical protein HPB49_024927 [Dermacentor silvarum]